mmetsp:Transcript_80746/g.195852  ORF Transcript_80746/g.195852 Transcript_80746/m.195852 type:complete len:297 (+) Transcript_80746:1809-2699(+)
MLPRIILSMTSPLAAWAAPAATSAAPLAASAALRSASPVSPIPRSPVAVSSALSWAAGPSGAVPSARILPIEDGLYVCSSSLSKRTRVRPSEKISLTVPAPRYQCTTRAPAKNPSCLSTSSSLAAAMSRASSDAKKMRVRAPSGERSETAPTWLGSDIWMYGTKPESSPDFALLPLMLSDLPTPSPSHILRIASLDTGRHTLKRSSGACPSSSIDESMARRTCWRGSLRTNFWSSSCLVTGVCLATTRCAPENDTPRFMETPLVISSCPALPSRRTTFMKFCTRLASPRMRMWPLA